MAKELNSGLPRTNPESSRVEDLSQGPPDFKSSALNNSATLPPFFIWGLELLHGLSFRFLTTDCNELKDSASTTLQCFSQKNFTRGPKWPLKTCFRGQFLRKGPIDNNWQKYSRQLQMSGRQILVSSEGPV